MKRGRGGESPSDSFPVNPVLPVILSDSFYEEEEEREKEDRITG